MTIDAHGPHTMPHTKPTRMSGAPPATHGHFSFAKRSAQNDKRTPAHYGYGTNGLCSFTSLVLPFRVSSTLCVLRRLGRVRKRRLSDACVTACSCCSCWTGETDRLTGLMVV